MQRNMNSKPNILKAFTITELICPEYTSNVFKLIAINQLKFPNQLYLFASILNKFVYIRHLRYARMCASYLYSYECWERNSYYKKFLLRSQSSFSVYNILCNFASSHITLVQVHILISASLVMSITTERRK